VKDRTRRGRPRYRKGALALVLAVAACTGECNTIGGPVDVVGDNVSIRVFLTGDGDGQVDVTDTTSWRCVSAAGSVTASGGATRESDHCHRSFFDAGGGAVRFRATPSAESVFGGWSSSCAGTAPDCTVMWTFGAGGADISVGAEFLFAPSGVTVEVADPDLTQGMTTQATANLSASRALQGVEYAWASSNPSVASIAGAGAQATVTGLSPGTTEISATARGVVSNAVTVTVSPGVQSAKGFLEGVLYDVDGVTPLDSVYLSGGPVEGSQGDALRGRTGRQNPLDPGGIPPGGYRFEATNGRYAMFSVAVLGKRYLTTPGDTADVLAGETTELNLFVADGYGLDMLGTDLGTIQATAGSTVNLTVDYNAWNRDLCPGCVPSLGIGVDSTALNVYRFGVAGVYPGKTETGVSIPITVPDHGGTIYATLITRSTASGIEPGLALYRELWAANLQGTTMIPIGILVVN